MTELTQDLSLAQARSLIDSYAFDLGHDDAERLLEYWLNLYHANWIRLATIEALYLGRYKAISVEHILNVWLRIGTPNPHFTYEFERLICRKLPKHLSDLSNFTASATKNTVTKADRAKPEKSESETPFVKQQHNTAVAVADSDAVNLEKAFSNPSASASSIPLISSLGFSYKSNWTDLSEGSKMIHQFIPLPDVSSFFAKLKTFGEER